MAFGIDDLIAEGLKLVNKYIPDPEQRAKAAAELQASAERLRTAQIQLNTAETQNGSILGKWRGGLGWILAVSAGYQLVVQPVLISILLAIDHTFPVDKMPKLEWQELGRLLLGILGLS